jgi:uncharacterized protein YndB with AHSA1/START domain
MSFSKQNEKERKPGMQPNEKLANEQTRIDTPNDVDIVMVRDFRAPRALVFEAMSKAEHIRRWFHSCPGMALPVCEVDFRLGGKFRYVMKMEGDPSGGGELSGEYTEIVRPDRIVHTQRWAPVPGSDHVVTIVFAERNGVTTLTQRFTHTSKVNRDGHLQSGLEQVLDSTFDALEKVAQGLDTAAPVVAHAPR